MAVSAKQLARAFVNGAGDLSGASLTGAAATFVKFLSDRRELHRMREVLRAVEGAWREKYGAATVVVETAKPLSTKSRKVLEEKTAGATIIEQVKPELIGGARVRIDDRILDGSVSGQLDALKRSLAE
jgi:F-type H+-transporting ATPase subunit delta